MAAALARSTRCPASGPTGPPSRRPNSPGWGVRTHSRTRRSHHSSVAASALSAVASMTAGAGTVPAPECPGRSEAPDLPRGGAPCPTSRGPVAGRVRRQGRCRGRAAMAATARPRRRCPARLGQAHRDELRTRPAMTGCRDAGTESVTSPAPRAAPRSRPGAPRPPNPASRTPPATTEGALVPIRGGGRAGTGRPRPASSRMAAGDRAAERLMACRRGPSVDDGSGSSWFPARLARGPADAPCEPGSRRSRSSSRASISTGNTNAPPWVRMPNAMATAYSRSWLMDTATRAMPSWSARRRARSCSRTVGWPVGSRTISISRQPTPRTPRPRTLLTASLAAQRPGEVLGSVPHIGIAPRR